MGIAGDMKKIGDDIIASYDMRVKAVGALVSDVQKTLRGFATDRKRMSKEQAKALADFVTDLTDNVGTMIEGFASDRMKMGAEQQKALRRFVTDLAKNVDAVIKGFTTDRKRMSKEQKKALKDFVTDLTDSVSSMIKGFTTDRKRMSKEQKKELADFVEDLTKNVGNMIRGFLKDRKAMADEIKKMAANWQSMAATMAKRRGIKPEVKAAVKVRPVEEAIEEEEAEGLDDKVLEVLEENPNGITLTEMAYAIGVPFQKLTGPTRRLISRGEVRKEDKLYFLA